jgi:hypothetical protein
MRGKYTVVWNVQSIYLLFVVQNIVPENINHSTLYCIVSVSETRNHLRQLLYKPLYLQASVTEP